MHCILPHPREYFSISGVPSSQAAITVAPIAYQPNALLAWLGTTWLSVGRQKDLHTELLCARLFMDTQRCTTSRRARHISCPRNAAALEWMSRVAASNKET